ncbi:hypothetical protein OROHE_016743 [Orobanche hederae]
MATSGSKTTRANNYNFRAQSSGAENSHHHRSHNTTNNSSMKRGGDSTNKAVAQYTEDARLHTVFEQTGESGKTFDYSQSVRPTNEFVPEQQIAAYLSKM